MEKRDLPPRVLHALERGAVVLWFAAIAFLLFVTLKAQLARAAPPARAVGMGTLLGATARDVEHSAALATNVHVDIAGVVARVTVTQRFRHPGGGGTAAHYAFPLPGDASVDRFKVRSGERVIEHSIGAHTARDPAPGTPLAHTPPRHGAARLFTTPMPDVGSGELEVTLEYTQTARYDAGELAVRLPLTFPERGAASTTAGVPVALRFPANVPKPRGPSYGDAVRGAVAISIDLAPGLPVEHVVSRAHPARITAGRDRYAIEMTEPRSPLDRDFVVAWRPETGGVAAATALTETIGDDTYALLTIFPPADSPHVLAREVLLVVDTSGSMSGAALEQLQYALEHAVDTLRGGDRFNLFQFNSAVTSLYRAPVPATTESRAEARAWIRRLRATGGTELEPAIRAALAQPTALGFVRQVVLVTDGAIAHDAGLLETIERDLRGARLFTIGVGPARNAGLMRRAAETGRGKHIHVYDPAALAATLEPLFDDIADIVLTDLHVEWPGGAEVQPVRLPDLHAGAPVVVAARYPGRDARQLAVPVFGRAAGDAWSQRVVAEPAALSHVAGAWARRNIERRAADGAGDVDDLRPANTSAAVLTRSLELRIGLVLALALALAVVTCSRLWRRVGAPTGS